MIQPKDKSRVVTITIKESYIKKLEKIMSNYNRNGKPYTFSGAINRILFLGFQGFEQKHIILIDDLESNRMEDEVEDEEK